MRKRTGISIIVLILLLTVLAYSSGYLKGQESVYEKAKNDAQFEKQVWGK